MSISTPTPLQTAQARIADCLQLSGPGRLVQRREHLNLANLKLTDAEFAALTTAFDPQERGLPAISLASLPHLRYLDLTGNQLTKLPECITRCGELVWLGLNFNQLTTLPETLGELRKLQRLYLRGNGLKSLPEGIGALADLIELDLSGNQIAGLPVGIIPLLEKGGAKAKPGDTTLHLDLGGNPCQAATAAEQGRETLLAFLRDLREESGRPQGKLLLVGEGRVGKSSLLHALLGRDHNENLLSTHGLKIEQWEVKGVPGHPEPVRLNCWDFSGQEQMRETHQMFFTAPALYLLVWDPDRHQRESEEQLYEWLWLIHQSQREGARARVLIVATNHRSRDRHEPDNKGHLLREFGPEGAGILHGFLSVESDNLRGERVGIAAVQAWVRQQMTEDRAFAQAVPARWEQVVAACLDTGKPIISWPEFLAACATASPTTDGRKRTGPAVGINAEAVARQMNALGRIVWYGDDAALREQVILRPDWLSKAISYVFERASLEAVPGSPETPLGKGLVSRVTMDALWTNPRTRDESGNEEPGYAASLFPVFRRLMRRFDLLQPLAARSIPGANPREMAEAEYYLVPARLGRERPDTWDREWNAREIMTLRFSLTSRGLTAGGPRAALNDWLARAVFGRLIVWLHPEAQGREQVEHAAHWESGLRLRDTALGEARLCAEKDRIYFEGSAHLHGQVVSALRGLLAEMNRRFGTEMQFSEEVACQPAARKGDDCPICPNSLEERRYFVPQFLKNCLAPENGEEPERRFWCGGAKECPHKIDVVRSLHGVVVPASRIEQKLDEIADQVTRVEAVVSRQVRQFEEWHERHCERIGQLLRASQPEMTAAVRQEMQVALGEWKPLLLEALREFDAAVMRHGPCLFSIESADGHHFWTDAGPRLADKVRVHLHCEHTLLPASWFKHDGGKAPGVFELEKVKPWLAKAGPMIQGIGRLLGAGAPLAAALGAAELSLLVKAPAEFLKGMPEEIFAKPAKLPGAGPDAAEKFDPRRPTEAEGEVLKQLHQILREKLKAQELTQAPGLGLVRVWNRNANRHSWVHRFYAVHYGGEQ